MSEDHTGSFLLQDPGCFLFDIFDDNSIHHLSDMLKPTTSHPQPSKRSAHLSIRKIRRLQKRIRDLETEVMKLRQNQKPDSCNCNIRNECTESGAPLDRRLTKYSNGDNRCKEQTPCHECLQLEEFQLGLHEQEIKEQSRQLSGQNWMMTGVFLIAMGLNVNGYDDSSLDVYKVTHQCISSVRQQIEECAEEIMLPIFYSKLLSQGEVEASGCFQLEGVRFEGVDEERLVLEERLSLRVKYEALLVLAEYIKEYVVLT